MECKNISRITASSYLQHGMKLDELQLLDRLLSDYNGRKAKLIAVAFNRAAQDGFLVQAMIVLKDWNERGRFSSVEKICADIVDCKFSLSIVNQVQY